ncbi:MAG: ATP synthase F1 subunit epsilon [Candidatus Cloacimonetes bacterium]|nr:ATP synthase F1 subunit epsilon [Candidatus Cloacimonadota bacterium]
MDNLKLEVILPDKIKISQEIDHVIVPGCDGDLGISPGHTPLITKLRPGIMKVYTGQQISYYAIHDGFLTIENNHVRIVSETVEEKKEINFSRAESSLQRAQQRLKGDQSDTDFRRAEASLKRATARLNLKF